MSNIQLSNGKVTAEVQLRGAQLASFRAPDGREVIWQADPAVWAQHAPVLFPVCGTAKDNQVILDGKAYPMAKHGFTRNPDFQVARLGEDYIDLVLTPTEESRPMYPFQFAFHVCYQLLEDGWTTTFLVENLDDKPMPFCVGGHPGFNCPMEGGASFEDYVLVFPQDEDGKNMLAPGGGEITDSEILPELQGGHTLRLNHALFDERDALIFTTLKSRSVDLVHRVSGRGIRFAFPKMEVLAVWSKPHANADYVCLEPWHGMPALAEESGRFEDKPFVTILQPGQVHTSWFTATVI